MHAVDMRVMRALQAFWRCSARGFITAALLASCAIVASIPSRGLAQEPAARRAAPERLDAAPLALQARPAELEAVPRPFRVDPAQLRRVAALDPERRRHIAEVGARLARDGFDAGVDAEWRALVRQAAPSLGRDPEALVRAVLLEAYLTTKRDLELYAERVRIYEETRRSLRKEIEGLRARSAASPGHRAERERGLRDLAELLEETRQGEQLARMDLQDAQQSQQQTLQMLSNISRLLHDTAMAVIRNMKA